MQLVENIEPLDKFGKFVVENLRDKAIKYYDGLENGHWKAPSLKLLQERLQDFDNDQLHVIRKCIIEVVDSSVHNFLFALQENHEIKNDIQVIVDGINVAEISNGLHGEPYTEDGWYTRFSTFGENIIE